MSGEPVPTGPHDAAGFDYARLPASVRGRVRDAAEQVRSLAYRTACDMIRTGQLLAACRGMMKRPTFRRWLAEFPWSRAHSFRLMAVGEVFGPLVAPDRAERIDPTALYLLARPDAPPEARRYAVELCAERRVTAADAREILSAHRERPDVPAAEVKRLAPLLPEDRRREPAGPPPAAAADPARAWAALEHLAATARVVHVGVISEEHDEDGPLYAVTVYSDDRGPRNAVRRTLADAVLAAAGREPEKTCGACERTKPVGQFGCVRTQPDGRNRYCKTCERARLGAIKKRKKAGRAARPAS